MLLGGWDVLWYLRTVLSVIKLVMWASKCQNSLPWAESPWDFWLVAEKLWNSDLVLNRPWSFWLKKALRFLTCLDRPQNLTWERSSDFWLVSGLGPRVWLVEAYGCLKILNERVLNGLVHCLLSSVFVDCLGGGKSSSLIGFRLGCWPIDEHIGGMLSVWIWPFLLLT